MTEPLLTITGATKSYGAQEVLRINEFSLNAGDRVQILGANGSGKSTFLRLVAGITPPSRGRVQRSSAMLAMAVGFVPAEGGLYGELSLRKNAQAIHTVISGNGPKIENAEGLFDDFRLTPHLDRPVHALSDGMRRLATFVCILQARPNVLLIDEPFSGVDREFSDRLQQLLLLAGGTLDAVLVTSHSALAAFDSWKSVAVDGGRI